jgi:hypothetical protein
VGNNASEDKEQHDSIVTPVCQDLLDFGIAKAEDAQGGAIILLFV